MGFGALGLGGKLVPAGEVPKAGEQAQECAPLCMPSVWASVLASGYSHTSPPGWLRLFSEFDSTRESRRVALKWQQGFRGGLSIMPNPSRSVEDGMMARRRWALSSLAVDPSIGRNTAPPADLPDTSDLHTIQPS